MCKIRGINKADIEEVSTFISKLNNREESHIGYCGTDQKEVAKYMQEEITDVPYFDSFVGAYENNQLVGVLGFDADLEDKSAEIWGPFINKDKWDIVFSMWEKAISLLPKEIDSLEMFPNLKNTRVCQLARDLSFNKYSDETILVFSRSNSNKLEGNRLEELTPKHHHTMKQLHNEAFPNAYYDGEQIMKRLNENRKVFVITKNEELSGYIYVEAEPEFGEASIKFFAVAPIVRGKGIGRQLLAGSLKWLFTFESMDSITLCVNSTNQNAINLYKKVGFQHQHDLISFTKDVGKK
ncbi:GNAT family N-acetyltransferase [Oceanobacillus manasiensis]|uniref:GNAT family N-acetyltransferase n=1 Tax=Oceanobacillus manasiensis TaxID=586413 RepID=UPI0005A7E1D9|nr:GNAT family N-acetyltransferase [Oceanobacillus manasiensis]